MADPEFSPGSEHTAHALMMNNTPKAWTYDSELYLVKAGTKYASSGIITFTLAAGASRTIDFPIIMPDEGTYKVYLDIYVGGELIATYIATEDVVIVAAVVGFSYGTPTCQLVSPHPRWPDRDDLGRLIFSVPVTNLGGAQTRLLTIMYRSITWGTGPFDVDDTHFDWNFPLGAGATRIFEYDSPDSLVQERFYLYKDGVKQKYAFWIEDDAGGKSEECVW